MVIITNPKAPSVEFKINSIHNAGRGLVVDGTVGDNDCQITVGTGSEITLIRPDLLEGVDWQPEVCWLWIVTGEWPPIHGRRQPEGATGNRKSQVATGDAGCRHQG